MMPFATSEMVPSPPQAMSSFVPAAQLPRELTRVAFGFGESHGERAKMRAQVTGDLRPVLARCALGRCGLTITSGKDIRVI
jgi:hypothetical protein